MTLGILDWLSAIGLPILFGAGILRCVGIRFRDDRLGWPAWAWMSGTLGTALLLYASLWIGLPIRAGILAPVVALVSLGALFLGKRRTTTAKKIPKAPVLPVVPSAARSESLLLGLILAAAVLVVGDRMINTNRTLVVAGDEMAIWAHKAKVIHQAGGFNQTLHDLTHPQLYARHEDYPLLNPLLQLWIFAHAGEVTHVDNRVPIQLHMVALLLALAAALRRQVRPSLAAALLVLVSTTPPFDMLSRWAMSDHLVALGLVVAFDAWLAYRATNEDRWWKLMFFAFGFMAWSKNESFLILAAIGAVGALALAAPLRTRAIRPGRISRRRLAWVAVPVGLVAAHWTFNSSFDFRNDLTEQGLFRLLFEQWSERAPIISERLVNLMLWTPFNHADLGAFGAWGKRAFETNLLFAAALVALLCFPLRLLRSAAGTPALVLLAAQSGFFLVYVGSPHPVEWHMSTSIVRVYFSLVPATALWLALALAVLMPVLRARPWPPVGCPSDQGQT